MKALLRHEGETVLETDGITGIDWNTGYPLTSQEWCGGPYKLIENYVPPADEDEIMIQPEQPEVKEETVENDDYVVIGGKKYSKEELRSLLE